MQFNGCVLIPDLESDLQHFGYSISDSDSTINGIVTPLIWSLYESSKNHANVTKDERLNGMIGLFLNASRETCRKSGSAGVDTVLCTRTTCIIRLLHIG